MSKDICASVRGWRKKAGLTICQLAELAEIDAGFLAYIETGKKMPSLTTTAKLARALSISLADLFAHMPKETPNLDDRVHLQVRSLCHGRTRGEKDDLVLVLKRLHDPEKVRALRKIMG